MGEKALGRRRIGRRLLGRVPKVVPYNHHAVDADRDGIIQEGTIWERPAGMSFNVPHGSRRRPLGAEPISRATKPSKPEVARSRRPVVARSRRPQAGDLGRRVIDPETRKVVWAEEPVHVPSEFIDKSPFRWAKVPWLRNRPPEPNLGDDEANEVARVAMTNRDGGVTGTIRDLMDADMENAGGAGARLLGLEAVADRLARPWASDSDLPEVRDELGDPISDAQVLLAQEYLYQRTQEFLADLPDEVVVYRFGNERGYGVVSFTLNPRYDYDGNLPWASALAEHQGEEFVRYKVKKSDIKFAMDIRNGPVGGEDELLIDFADVEVFPEEEVAGFTVARSRVLEPGDVAYRGAHQAPSRSFEGGDSLDDLSEVMPDAYGVDGIRLYGTYGMDAANVEMRRVLALAEGNPDALVTVYRAVPKGSKGGINQGDWVSPSRAYAKEHGSRWVDRLVISRGGKQPSPDDKGFEIVEMTVRASELISEGNSLYEFGYDPQELDVVHHKGPKRDMKKVVAPILDLFNSIFVAPRLRGEGPIHIITGLVSGHRHAEYSPFDAVPAKRKPSLKSPKFHPLLRHDRDLENEHNEFTIGSRGGLPFAMRIDLSMMKGRVLSNKSNTRKRPATPEEIEAQRAANMADDEGNVDVRVIWPPDGVDAVPWVRLDWDGTAEDASSLRDPSWKGWAEWEEKGYASEREYIMAALDFQTEWDEWEKVQQQKRDDVYDPERRRVIRIFKAVKRGELSDTNQQVSFVHELFHHYDFALNPRGVTGLEAKRSEMEAVALAAEQAPGGVVAVHLEHRIALGGDPEGVLMRFERMNWLGVGVQRDRVGGQDLENRAKDLLEIDGVWTPEQLAEATDVFEQLREAGAMDQAPEVKVVQELIRAALDTQTLRDLRRLGVLGDAVVRQRHLGDSNAYIDSDHIEYLLDPAEIWARLATQWFVFEYGTPEMQANYEADVLRGRAYDPSGATFTRREMIKLGPLVKEVLQTWNVLR